MVMVMVMARAYTSVVPVCDGSQWCRSDHVVPDIVPLVPSRVVGVHDLWFVAMIDALAIQTDSPLHRHSTSLNHSLSL